MSKWHAPKSRETAYSEKLFGILESMNRKPVVLVVVVQVRAAEAVVQAHVVREVAIVLGRTPEVRVVALVVVIPIEAPEAGRELTARAVFFDFFQLKFS